MTTIADLDARLLELEQLLLAAPAPLAANPPVQIGELTDVPAPGSPILSAWSQEVTARINHRFASTAARTTAWSAPNPVPVKGTMSYLATNNPTEGPEYWDGVAWRKPWNLPWGALGVASVAVAQSGYDSVVRDINTLAVTVATTPGRVLRAVLYVPFTTTVNSFGQFYITLGDNTILQSSATSTFGVSAYGHLFAVYNTGVASVTIKGRVNTGAGANLTVAGSSTSPALLVVEDVGPAAGNAPS